MIFLILYFKYYRNSFVGLIFQKKLKGGNLKKRSHITKCNKINVDDYKIWTVATKEYNLKFNCNI